MQKNVQLGEFLKTSSLRSNSITRQVTLMLQKLVKMPKFKCDILGDFKTLWPLETTEVMSFLKPPKIKVHTWFNPMFDVVQIGDIINLWILHPWKILLELDASFDAETHKHETTNSDGDPDNAERIDEPVVRIWKEAEKQLDQKF